LQVTKQHEFDLLFYGSQSQNHIFTFPITGSWWCISETKSIINIEKEKYGILAGILFNNRIYMTTFW